MPKDAEDRATTDQPRTVAFSEAFAYWLRLGFVNFGGPAGQIAMMYRDLVEKRRWISEQRFLNALNFCMVLPGPEAQQLAIYIGWLLHRTPGGLAAGILFVLPSVFILLGLSYVYAAFGSLPAIAGILSGLQAVVVAIVLAAVLKIGRRALRTPLHMAIAAAAFAGIYFLGVPYPAIVIGAGLVGLAANWKPIEAAQTVEDQDPSAAPRSTLPARSGSSHGCRRGTWDPAAARPRLHTRVRTAFTFGSTNSSRRLPS